MALLNVLKQAYADTDAPPGWKAGAPITVKLKRPAKMGPLTVSRVVVFPPTRKELLAIGADVIALREVGGGLTDIVVDPATLIKAMTTLLRWPANLIAALPLDELAAITSAVRAQLHWAVQHEKAKTPPKDPT
jgi:hypothetical protein